MEDTREIHNDEVRQHVDQVERWVGSVPEEAKTLASWSLPERGPAAMVAHFQKLMTVRNALERPLRIAVCGENNAGKSTLINALIGDNIATTNYFEFTFCPMVFSYGEDASARIDYDSGDKEQIDLESVNERILAIQASGASHTVRRVSVHMPIDSLKKYELADVPGVGATDRNEHLSHAFMNEVDAVLFVINGTLLGQKDLTEDIADLNKLFGSVAVVVNKIDQIGSGNAQEACDFVASTLQVKAIPVVPMNALDALEWRLNDHGLHETSRDWLAVLEHTFLAELAANGAAIKTRTAMIRMRQELIGLIPVFQAAYHQGLRAVKLLEKAREEMMNARQDISHQISSDIEDWIHREAFVDVRNRVPAMLASLPEVTHESMEQALQGIFTDQLIITEGERLGQWLDNAVKRRWNEAINTISEAIHTSFSPFQLETSQEILRHESADSMTIIQSKDNSLLDNLRPEDVTSATRMGILTGGASATLAGVLTTFTAAGAIATVGVPIAIAAVGLSVLHSLALRRSEQMRPQEKEAILEQFRINISKKLVQEVFPDGSHAKIIEDIDALMHNSNQALVDTLWTAATEDHHADLQVVKAYIEDGISINQEVTSQLQHIELPDSGGNAADLQMPGTAAAAKARVLFSASQRYSSKDLAELNTHLIDVIILEDTGIDIVDRHFSLEGLTWLEQVPTHLPIRILLYEIEQDTSARTGFLSFLEHFRQQREGGVVVRAVKYRDSDRTPLDQHLIGGTGWLLRSGKPWFGSQPVERMVAMLGADEVLEIQLTCIDRFWSMDLLSGGDDEIQVIDL